MKQKHIDYYMDIAFRTAELSDAKRLKVGAVLVRDNRPLMVGYNGTPEGYHTNVCEDENGVTKPEVIHAERNIICRMAKGNESTEGSELFMTHSPCVACSVMIFQSGIKKIYYRHEYRIPDGIKVLKSLGVVCEKI